MMSMAQRRRKWPVESVEVRLRPASLVRRVESTLNTAVVIVVVGVVSSLIARVLAVDELLHEAGLSTGTSGAIDAAVFLLIWVTPILLDSIINRATYGMRARQLSFADKDQRALGRRRVAARIACGALLLPLFPVSLVIALLDDRNRTLADLVCGTVVLSRDNPPSNPEAVRCTCGYDLTGNTSSTCPECGQRVGVTRL
jgi:hypothetical protein